MLLAQLRYRRRVRDDGVQRGEAERRGAGGQGEGARLGQRGHVRRGPGPLRQGGRPCSIYTVSTQYLLSIYTVYTQYPQYLHLIYTVSTENLHSIYTISTQNIHNYLRSICTVSTKYHYSIAIEFQIPTSSTDKLLGL